MLLEKSAFNENLLNILRVYNTRNELFQTEKMKERISKNQPVSYENEMLSLTSYRYFIDKFHIQNAKLKLPDIIQTLTITEKYYEETKEKLNSIEIENYSIRNKIFNVIRESIVIQHNHIIMSDNKIQDHLSDQIGKLKNFYLNSE